MKIKHWKLSCVLITISLAFGCQGQKLPYTTDSTILKKFSEFIQYSESYDSVYAYESSSAIGNGVLNFIAFKNESIYAGCYLPSNFLKQYYLGRGINKNSEAKVIFSNNEHAFLLKTKAEIELNIRGVLETRHFANDTCKKAENSVDDAAYFTLLLFKNKKSSVSQYALEEVSIYCPRNSFFKMLLKIKERISLAVSDINYINQIKTDQ